MEERHEHYLADLHARHAAELGALRIALAGRRPGILRDAERRYVAVERETERILRTVSRDIWSPANNPGGAEFRARARSNASGTHHAARRSGR